MTNTYLSDKDLAARFGVTRFTIWRWARERSDFPRPISLSPGCTRWKLSQIEAWEKAKEGGE
ncbi:MAG: AlpA family phage regulatory protein [Ruegeria sp.]|nr:AlpA family phage regulatory protein [Ruegeria sp.]